MPKISVYNFEGSVVGDMQLPDMLFGVKADPALVHEAVVAQRANARHAIASTKNRGEVRGGGRKPWKQKGTGRARQGSIRSPQWKGGGIVFGPTNERNFSKKMNRKAKQKALFMVLSDKLANEKMRVVEALQMEPLKTKTMATMMTKIPTEKSILLVLPASSPTVVRMVRNLPHVKAVTVQSLNLLDVLTYRTVLFVKDSVAALEKIYA